MTDPTIRRTDLEQLLSGVLSDALNQDILNRLNKVLPDLDSLMKVYNWDHISDIRDSLARDMAFTIGDDDEEEAFSSDVIYEDLVEWFHAIFWDVTYKEILMKELRFMKVEPKDYELFYLEKELAGEK